ncbi:hypothetical protein Droror1_Dr00008956 [Drosera rotundifolia]
MNSLADNITHSKGSTVAQLWSIFFRGVWMRIGDDYLERTPEPYMLFELLIGIPGTVEKMKAFWASWKYLGCLGHSGHLGQIKKKGKDLSTIREKFLEETRTRLRPRLHRESSCCLKFGVCQFTPFVSATNLVSSSPKQSRHRATSERDVEGISERRRRVAKNLEKLGCCASKGWLGNLVEGEVAARILVGCGRSFGEHDLRLRLDLLVIEFWELKCGSESSCASESVEDLTCRLGFEIPLLRGIPLTYP